MTEQRDYKLLRAADVAEMVGCSTSTIWRWTSKGEFPLPVKIGGSTRWLSTEVQQYIAFAIAER